MLTETMTEVDNNVLRHKFLEQNSIFNEYDTIVTSLKEELNICKLEQNKLRLEIESLREENKNANYLIQHTLTESKHDSCNNISNDKELQTNLEKRITILQMEKESVYQLWQMALKAIDVLEEELKNINRNDRNAKFYQEQITNVKASYSEAIKILESKLVAEKESFFQQQTLWEKSKDKIDQLTKEKNDTLEQFNNFKQQALEREKNLQTNLETLKENSYISKSELEQMKKTNIELEEKLKNSQKILNSMLLKDQEATNKVSEAVAVVELAVREKEEAIRRESQVTEEKLKLESRLANLSEEYTSRLENEVIKAKEIYNKNVKKYLIEIKELKAELREQGTLLDRSKREQRMVEEELERIHQRTENFAQTSSAKITSLEQLLKERESRLQISDESFKIMYDDRIRDLERQISNLQDRLANATEKLHRTHLQNSRDVDDHMREADDRTREMIEKCSNFERQLSRALMDKEHLTSNLHALEVSFEKEMQRRNHEKILLESKIRDLQENVINVDEAVSRSKSFLENPLIRKDMGLQTSLNSDSITSILALQEKFEKKTKELTHHVEAHQKLSEKWKEEANLLTNKFQKRTQEMKNKISTLQKQNEELSRELLFYQQLLARCNTQLIQNFSGDVENR